MKISFEVDARLIVVTSLAGLAGLFALHGAYPTLFGFWPTSSQDLAAWVQAVGSIAAIIGAFWIANTQTRQKKNDDLLRAQMVASAISVRLQRFSNGLSGFDVMTGFHDLEAAEPSVDQFLALQKWFDGDHYKPTENELMSLIALPNNAAHRLARGYEMLDVIKEIVAPGSRLESLFLGNSKKREGILQSLNDYIHESAKLIGLASGACADAARIGAPTPSYEELYGD